MLIYLPGIPRTSLSLCRLIYGKAIQARKTVRNGPAILIMAMARCGIALADTLKA